MSWAARRRFLILVIIGAVVAAFLAIVAIATFYKAPSCADNVSNQGEAGIDCGGPCAYLCTADEQPPTVLFTKAIQNSDGRTDVVSVVENKNMTAAAKNVPYKVSLYGSGQVLIQEVTGTLDLPPGATVPVFIPGVASGKQAVTNAFFTIDASAPKWFVVSGDPRVLPFISSTRQTGTSEAPRVEATLTNSSTQTLSGVRVIVLVRNTQKEVIAASQTIVRIIRPQDSATAIFTWNSAFSDIPASIDVMPVIPLPDR